jgi:hypothetical protein
VLDRNYFDALLNEIAWESYSPAWWPWSGRSPHDDDAGDQMEASQGFGQALIVSREPAATSHASDATLDMR